MAFGLLYASKFLLDTVSTGYSYKLAAEKTQRQYQDARRQIALNNQLNYNAHLNLNQQEVLELKKFGLDDFELKKKIRREQASDAVKKASFGGALGQTGGSFQAAQNNILRYGFNALARKDLNQKAVFEDFRIRHTNVDLQTTSQNNAAFSNLSAGPSGFASLLSIVGSGLQIATDAKKGTVSVDARRGIYGV